MKKYNFFDLAALPHDAIIPEDVNKLVVSFVKDKLGVDISAEDVEIRTIKPFGNISVPSAKKSATSLSDAIKATKFLQEDVYNKYKAEFETVWEVAQKIITVGSPISVDIEFHKGVIKRYIVQKHTKNGVVVKISVNNDMVDFSKKNKSYNSNPKEVNNG